MTHTSENAPSNRLTYNVNDNNDVDASTMTLPMSSAPAPVESSDPEPALAVFLAKTSEPAKPPTAENNGSESPRSSALFKSSEELAVLRSNINLMADQLQVLLQKEESEAAAARLLNQLSVRLREARSAQQLFSVAVTEARETLQADRAIVYLFDEQWKGTVVAESVAKGWKAALGDKIADPCFAERYVESYRRGRVSVITNVFEAGLTECHLGQLIPYGIRANLVVPILSNQKLLGLLIAHQCSGPRAWHETEVDFLAKFAIQVGYAYDQITVMEQQSTTARQANLLNRISSRIRETLRPKEIFNVATQETRDALQADRVIVYQFDEKWQGSVVSESIGRGWKASLGANIADPCFAERYVEPYRLGRVSATPNIYEAGLTQCHIGQLEPYGVKANLVVPILSNQKLHGLLVAHQCSGPRQWQESDIDFFKQVAVQVGFALDQALLLEQQEYAAQQAQRLNRITARLREVTNSEDAFGIVVEESREALKSDRVVVYTLDEKRNGTVAAESVGRGWKAALGDITANICMSERDIEPYRRGRTSAISNVNEANLSPCHLDELKPYDIKANLAVPILANRKLYGMLIAHQCSGPRQWQESDIDFLRQLGTQLGFVLDQSEVQRQLAKTRLLEQSATVVINRMRQSLETEKIFSTATRDLRQLLKLDRVSVYRFNLDWGGEFIAESVGFDFPPLVGANIKTTWDDSYLQETEGGRYKNNETATVNDVREVGHTQCHVDKLEEFYIRAYVIAPIFVNNELWGLLGAYQSSDMRNWEESETVLVTRIAEQLGAAVTQAEFFQELQIKTEEQRKNAILQQKAAARAELLNKVVFNMRKTLRPQDIFTAAVESVQVYLEFNRVIVYAFDDNWQGTVVAESVEPVYPKALNAKITDPCFAQNYAQKYLKGRVQAVSNVNEAGLTECHLGQLAPFEVKANLVAPILANQKLYGLLIAHQCSGPYEWKKSEIEFFQQVGVQIGFALEQAMALGNAEQAKSLAEELSENQRLQAETLRNEIRAFMNDIQGSFDGDLTVRARLSEGEMGTVGDFFNATIENLQTLVLQVQGATSAVSEVARDSEVQVGTVSTEAARQSGVVAAALNQIKTSAQSIQGMSNQAQQAQSKVKQGRQIVSESDRAMNDMVASIKSVQQTVEQTAMKVKRLGEASQNIARIVNLIQDVAKQTNILALNASIESQPTSDDGQDFGIIAFQVRNLAEQSAEAANEIERIVSQIQTETSEAVNFMEVSQKQVNDGALLVEESRQKLSQITASSVQIEEMVEAIVQSANNEAQTSLSLSNTMQEVAAISNQTSSQSQTLMTSLSRLRQVTETLQVSVAEFKVQ